MRITLVTQARFGSTRLPRKVLLSIQDTTLLEAHLKSAARTKLCSEQIVASTHEKESIQIQEVAEKCGWVFRQGSTNDVLDRFYQVVKDIRPEIVVRITSDCPLVQAHLIDEAIQTLKNNNADYVSTSSDFPDGVDVEAFTFSALEHAWREATLPSEREHVTPYIRNNSEKAILIQPQNKLYKDVRLTVDEPADLDCIRHLVDQLGWERCWEEYGEYIVTHPNEFSNQQINRNEGYIKSLRSDFDHKRG